MPNEVMLAVLLSAALNAGWNSAVKIGGDRTAVMALTTLVGSAISLLALPLVALPSSQGWALLALSIAIHTVYHFVLPMAYARGDLGLVFPVARGSAPLLVMAGAAAFAGEMPGAGTLLGVACLSLGILLLAWGAGRGRSRPAVGYALLAGVLIASYTVIDAMGARQGGSALGFAVLVSLGDGIATVLAVLCWKGRRALAVDARTWRLCAAAGAMQMGAYWIAVWALAQAPMASVSALRETSVLFVALISAFVLKEGLGRRRLAAAALVCAGIALVRLA
ncbi:DMT family transporter [Pseudorhodoferax sp.]|uniref:DMT family transporter n=1 Tax=Pseudorhodoferax sp. TaxID=1993553 RepID=UPI002DD6386D|nr:DMT family transporter [Pseudorhodoferax sp.]